MKSSEYILLLFATIIFGSVMGAYFSTAEYRIRHNEPLITMGCYCPNCHHKLAGVQQIPVISWLFLKGKCYYCKAPIPLRYPLIEGGFLIYYGITFLALNRFPLLMILSWIGFVTLLLLIRCRGNRKGLFKGILIFGGYHLLYGSVIFVLLSVLRTT